VIRVLLVLALAAITACNVNPYNLNSGDGDGGVDPGDGGSDGTPGDGGPDAPTDAAVDAACVPTPEVCNGLDDDCDMMIDDGFNLTADPNNCGTCGNRCTYPNAFGICNNSQCEQGACQPGWNDTMPGTAGCDYFCIPTNGGVEVCDNRDNDCDTTLDEGFNTQTDVNNCGSCGNVCNLLHASETCAGGVCEVAMCDPGFVDVNPAVPGCEYQCTPTGGGVETCDGVDNNCDGVVDDGNPGGGQPCGTDVGECTAGTFQCSNGVLFCVGAINGTPEVCDNEDDDCDGLIDDGFDKMNDPQHCGSCSPCNVPHAIAGCSMGMCTVATCDFGHFDDNGLPGDGCEYACIATGVEACDQRDNDCDGDIDEGINTTTDPNNCGSCGNVCSFANAGATCAGSMCQLGTCNPNFYDIDGQAANGCEYGCVTSNGGVEACDAFDNDCDGTVNEGNPGGGMSCGTSTGECSTGTTVCTGSAIDCVGGVGPVAETCNNLDDDCNGVTDNGFNKLTDPRYCNNCAGCNLDHAVAGCSGGACTVAQCLAGWVNLDGLPGNGCEYACTFSGTEVCDGVDNDCDGAIDEDCPPACTPTDEVCDGVDNNCDGTVDEGCSCGADGSACASDGDCCADSICRGPKNKKTCRAR
jgi:hypothetical protein